MFEDLVREVIKHIAAERGKLEKWMSCRNCRDHADYSYHCGRVAGLNSAESFLREEMQKQQQRSTE